MATSNNEEDEDEVISKQLSQQVGDLSINNANTSTVCANCGKEGNNINICNKCKATVYCNAACKKKHRSKHKEACERRVAELHEEQLERERRAAELHDKELFKQPLPNEDCPICMLPLPSFWTGSKYKSCCGKIICCGCIHAVKIRDGGVSLCPFCRTPAPNSEKFFELCKKRIEVDDAEGIRNLGWCYVDGMYGLPQDHAKALELWHRAAKLGNVKSYCNIGWAYDVGNGVERDEKKAVHYWELGAMGGHVVARHNLGMSEGQTGNMDRALKHFMIAAKGGYSVSLEVIKQMFMNRDATKDDYSKALRAYQANLVQIKSPQRDEAAAYDNGYKYY